MDGFECASLSVPVDRHDPNGRSLTLAVARHSSAGSPQQRIGTLVFIPGGPGDSGVDLLPRLWFVLPERLKQRFDLVTWDPRGTGPQRQLSTRVRTRAAPATRTAPAR